MYTVLLPLHDDVERAQRQADYIASLPCASEEVTVILGHAFSSTEQSAPEAMQRVDRVETVREASAILDDAGIETTTRELSSPAAEGILAVTADEEIDEVVMGGRKRSPAEKAILGSTTQTVILNADVPVTVVA
ncbi:MAG: universal stress protein [Halanaeroarchaeum sp.]